METRYKIIDNKGNIVFSSLSTQDLLKIDGLDHKSKMIEASRCGFFNNDSGSIYLVTENNDYIQSSKTFMKFAETILLALTEIGSIIQQAEQKHNDRTSHLIHNLATQNALSLQQLHVLVSQEELANTSRREQIGIVQKIIKSDTRSTALTLLKLEKYNAAMKSEFSVFKKLFISNPQLDSKFHNVHKVLMNVLYLFFSDFTDKEVEVSVTVENDNNKPINAFFDYESIHVVFYHLMHNAQKYVKPGTDINIIINKSQSHINLDFSMTSLAISEEEKNNIFNDGVSGKLAKEVNVAGSGIGLAICKNILMLNHAEIYLNFDTSSYEEVIGGYNYQKNIFTIVLSAIRF